LPPEGPQISEIPLIAVAWLKHLFSPAAHCGTVKPDLKVKGKFLTTKEAAFDVE
jgi:hypothetical protein